MVAKIVIVSIVFLSLFLSPSLLNVYSENILAPRKQMASGIEADDVVCKSGLVLMIRASNGAASCVKSSTSIELSAAGWGSIIIDDDDTIEDATMEDDTKANATKANATNTKTIELSEGLSMEIEEGSSGKTSEEEPFTIGGIDLSMASPVEGNVNASITIIEFGDYQCQKCKAWFQNEKSKITTNYIKKGIAKLYFVDSVWLGSDSMTAAQASYCANDQGKFIEYHSTLYNNQAGIQDGWAKKDALKQFAKDLKINTTLFNECLDSGKYADRVTYNTKVGTSLGIKETPYFVIVGSNGDIKKITGPQPSIVFDAAINSLS